MTIVDPEATLSADPEIDRGAYGPCDDARRRIGGAALPRLGRAPGRTTPSAISLVAGDEEFPLVGGSPVLLPGAGHPLPRARRGRGPDAARRLAVRAVHLHASRPAGERHPELAGLGPNLVPAARVPVSNRCSRAGRVTSSTSAATIPRSAAAFFPAGVRHLGLEPSRNESAGFRCRRDGGVPPRRVGPAPRRRRVPRQPRSRPRLPHRDRRGLPACRDRVAACSSRPSRVGRPRRLLHTDGFHFHHFRRGQPPPRSTRSRSKTSSSCRGRTTTTASRSSSARGSRYKRAHRGPTTRTSRSRVFAQLCERARDRYEFLRLDDVPSAPGAVRRHDVDVSVQHALRGRGDRSRPRDRRERTSCSRTRSVTTSGPRRTPAAPCMRRAGSRRRAALRPHVLRRDDGRVPRRAGARRSSGGSGTSSASK